MRTEKGVRKVVRACIVKIVKTICLENETASERRLWVVTVQQLKIQKTLASQSAGTQSKVG